MRAGRNIVRVFTSANLLYLDRALILQETIKRFHPDWIFTLVLVDEVTESREVYDFLAEFEHIILAKDLGIPQFENWIRKFSVVEACTAIKGFALEFLLGYGDDVLYLDPDIAVFNDLSELHELLKTKSVVLTPHILDPESDYSAIIDSEVNALKHGIFNLGFIAVSCTPEGNRFAHWWAWRLYDFCVEDFHKGLFVDQKWLNLAPAIFEDVSIWKHKGANLASWNISQRTLEEDTGNLLVDGTPLLFLHFSKARSAGPNMTMRYSHNNIALIHLWRWYIEKLNTNSKRIIKVGSWAYA